MRAMTDCELDGIEDDGVVLVVTLVVVLVGVLDATKLVTVVEE